CPDRHTLISTEDDQHWCYTIIWPVPPVQGYTFDDASEVCKSHGDVLPILNSEKTKYDVANFAYIHLGYLHSYWIGLVCGEVCDTWQWQDGDEFSS
ncbi:hypothetical protein PENTCL1PPCAC_20496, partial [Pristionchus entomophagus]